MIWKCSYCLVYQTSMTFPLCSESCHVSGRGGATKWSIKHEILLNIFKIIAKSPSQKNARQVVVSIDYSLCRKYRRLFAHIKRKSLRYMYIYVISFGPTFFHRDTSSLIRGIMAVLIAAYGCTSMFILSTVVHFIVTGIAFHRGRLNHFQITLRQIKLAVNLGYIRFAPLDLVFLEFW